jgi:hypothetical protein
VRIERGEGPETFARGLQVAPQLERIESLIDGLQRVALRSGVDARGAEPLIHGQNIAAERRYGESADQLRAGAADLVRLRSTCCTLRAAAWRSFSS